MAKENIIKEAMDKSIAIGEYDTMLQAYAKEGKTSGDQKENLIHFTKLNAQRSRRIMKTTQLMDAVVDKVRSVSRQTWLLITETWCGDAANSVPVIAKLAEENSDIDVRVVLRDENLPLMDQFLTNGGRSIPKLIGLDEALNVLFDWGPRPEGARALHADWKASDNGVPASEFQVILQKWYHDDKGQSIQQELLERLS